MRQAHQTEDQAAQTTSFQAIYEKYLPLLVQVSVFKFQVPDTEAETLAHDVLVQYLLRAPAGELRPWLIGAICHASRHYWRMNGRIIGADTEVELDRVDPSTLHILDSLPDTIAAREALECLAPRCQQILHMRYFEGCTVPEIAARLGVKPKFASKLLTKCLRRAEKLFADDSSASTDEGVKDAIDGFVDPYRKLG